MNANLNAGTTTRYNISKERRVKHGKENEECYLFVDQDDLDINFVILDNGQPFWLPPNIVKKYVITNTPSHFHIRIKKPNLSHQQKSVSANAILRQSTMDKHSKLSAYAVIQKKCIKNNCKCKKCHRQYTNHSEPIKCQMPCNGIEQTDNIIDILKTYGCHQGSDNYVDESICYDTAQEPFITSQYYPEPLESSRKSNCLYESSAIHECSDRSEINESLAKKFCDKSSPTEIVKDQQVYSEGELINTSLHDGPNPTDDFQCQLCEEPKITVNFQCQLSEEPKIKDNFQCQLSEEPKAIDDFQCQSLEEPKPIDDFLPELPKSIDDIQPEVPEEPKPIDDIIPESPEEPNPIDNILPELPEEPKPIDDFLPELPESIDDILPELPEEPNPIDDILPELPEEPNPIDDILPELPEEPKPIDDFLPELSKSIDIQPELPEEPKPIDDVLPELPEEPIPIAVLKNKPIKELKPKDDSLEESPKLDNLKYVSPNQFAIGWERCLKMCCICTKGACLDDCLSRCRRKKLHQNKLNNIFNECNCGGSYLQNAKTKITFNQFVVGWEKYYKMYLNHNLNNGTVGGGSGCI